MKSLGSLLVILGIVTIIYGFMDRVPKILSWIYDNGETQAWVIKIGLIVVGVVLYAIGARRKAAEAGDTSNP